MNKINDLISRQAAIDIERNATVDTNPSHFEAHQKFTQFMDDAEISSFGRWQWSNGFNTALTAVGIDLKKMPSAQPEPQWIPFKTRPLTEEEQDEHPEWDCILDCKLPDDGQVILVSINLRGHERVQYDEFYTDDGSYLDSGYAIGAEATAWMPLPEPYKERREE